MHMNQHAVSQSRQRQVAENRPLIKSSIHLAQSGAWRLPAQRALQRCGNKLGEKARSIDSIPCVHPLIVPAFGVGVEQRFFRP